MHTCSHAHAAVLSWQLVCDHISFTKQVNCFFTLDFIFVFKFVPASKVSVGTIVSRWGGLNPTDEPPFFTDPLIA